MEVAGGDGNSYAALPLHRSRLPICQFLEEKGFLTYFSLFASLPTSFQSKAAREMSIELLVEEEPLPLIPVLQDIPSLIHFQDHVHRQR